MYKHLLDCILPLGETVWAHKTSLTPPLFIKVIVPSQESERPCICVPGFSLGSDEIITSKVLRSSPWLGWPVWNICVTNDHGYVPLVVNTSRSFPHSWLITECVTRLTQWMPLVEEELPTLPEHQSSPRF